MLKKLDRAVVGFCNQWGMTLLRLSLAVVYIWFGALKMFDLSPVTGLIDKLHPGWPEPFFFHVLGAWEVLVGLGFLSNKFMRTTLVLMWAQMAGIMVGLLTNPELFFQNGNLLALAYDGEFLIKNLVLIAGTLVIAGQLKPRHGTAS